MLGWNFRTEEQQRKAQLQDRLIGVLYSAYDGIVFHGGTCIWRCYNGNRFSDDVDLYYGRGTKPESAEKEIGEFLASGDFETARLYHEQNRSGSYTVVAVIRDFALVRLELELAKKKGSPQDYSAADGGMFGVLSLSAEELINEKIEAYTDKLDDEANVLKQRHAEAKDLYDIYFLTGIVNSPRAHTADALGALMKRIGDRQPRDMGRLSGLMLRGVAPSFGKMKLDILRWLNEHGKRGS